MQSFFKVPVPGRAKTNLILTSLIYVHFYVALCCICKVSNQTTNSSKFHVYIFFSMTDSSGKHSLVEKQEKAEQLSHLNELSGHETHMLIFNNR